MTFGLYLQIRLTSSSSSSSDNKDANFVDVLEWSHWIQFNPLKGTDVNWLHLAIQI